MSMLNFADKLSELTLSDILLGASGNSHTSIYTGTGAARTILSLYVPLYFTADGHIITHGVDFTPDFSTGIRGLVKGSSGSVTEFLRGNNTWASISTTDLPMASNTSAATTSNLLSAKLIIDYVGASFAANDAMRFKGSIKHGNTNGTYIINTDPELSMPTCLVGDTYRVTESGIYAGTEGAGGVRCEPGDLLICIKDGTAPTNNSSSNTYWVGVLTNIEGTTKVTINGTVNNFYSSNIGSNLSFYAPTDAGTDTHILFSTGSGAPIWKALSNIVAGDLIASAKNALLSSVTASNGSISVKVGSTTKTATASGTWGISITGKATTAGTADKVANSLTFGTGLFGTDGTNTQTTYNGSKAITLNLKPATQSTLGGVMVDTTILTIDPDGSLGVDADNLYNVIKDKISGLINTVAATYRNVVGGTNSTDNTAVSTNPYLNLILTIQGGGSTKMSSILLTGSGITVTSLATGALSFTLNLATSNARGGIKIGYSETGQNYAVKLSSEKAYVTVPWRNTTYSFTGGTNKFTVTPSINGTAGEAIEVSVTPSIAVVSSSANGLAPKVINTNTATVSSAYYILASSNGSNAPSWYKLPTTAFSNTNTWRAINVNGTNLLGTGTGTGAINFVGSGKTTVTGSGSNITINSTWREILIGGVDIGNQILNILPSEEVAISADTGDGTVELSFRLAWYNISTGKHETA